MNAVGEFVARLHGASLPADTVERLAQVIAAGRYLATASDLAASGSPSPSLEAALAGTPVGERLEAFRRSQEVFIGELNVEKEDFSGQRCEDLAKTGRELYEAFKGEVLKSAARGEMEVGDAAALLEQVNRQRRFGERVLKGVRILSPLRDITLAPPKADRTRRESAGVITP